MAANKPVYVCSACGNSHPKWNGQCGQCSAWNTLEETNPTLNARKTTARSSAFSSTQSSLTPTNLRARVPPPPRVSTSIDEFDRVLGGGLVEGSAVLVAGDPGAGKSTLLMQAMAALSKSRKVLYASGEESLDQIQLRAERLDVADSDVALVTSNDGPGIAGLMQQMERGSVVVIDSLHAMDAGADSAPGSVAQVKAAASLFIPIAKERGITTLLINHVTKEGGFAGPQLLKHAVDVSLLLQNDTSQGFMRVLRADKNRFGADDEIGLFEMGTKGMMPITNPSELFMAQRAAGAFGTTIFASLEGTRPLLLEVQALVTPTTFGTGRRQATGWDSQRLNMLLAMMGARMGIALGDRDIYLNVAGGLKITDPGMDLAVVLALLSGYLGRPVREGIVAFGEVGLAGEIRGVMRPEARIREAKALGFSTVVCPGFREGKVPPAMAGTVRPLDRVARLMERIDAFLEP